MTRCWTVTCRWARYAAAAPDTAPAAWPGRVAGGCWPGGCRRHRKAPGRRGGRAAGHQHRPIRYALERVPRPARHWGKAAAPVVQQWRQRAGQVLTREFFEREYLQGGKTLRELQAQTGFPRKCLAERAREHQIPVDGTARIDPGWLREQYLARRRSYTDIAAELGVIDMTVIAAARRHGIPSRPQGVHSRPEMLTKLPGNVPRDIRRAVEGGLKGWHRLRRFQIAMTYPTIQAAATHLRTHCSPPLRMSMKATLGMRTPGGEEPRRACAGRGCGGRGAGGGLVDDGLAGGVGREQGGDGEPVDGAGQAAGLGVDGVDGVVGEQGVGPAGVLEVAADVPAGFRRAERGCGDVVAELDALVQGGHVADAEPAPQGGLADQQDGQRGPGIKIAIGQHSHGVQLLAGEQV